MAGPFTHMLVTQWASEPRYLPHDLVQLLDKHQCYMLLGSVSPDLPAIWDNVDKDGWSEKFHRDPKTNGIILAAFEDLLSRSAADGRLAWLFGYAAHLVTDVVVHPVVARAKQGRNNADIHQEIEIDQDALTFFQLKTYDLKTLDFLDWLEEVHSAPNRATFDQTMTLWSDKVSQCYKTSADCALWYWTYVHAVDAARWFPFKFRNFTYQPAAKISTQDKSDFFLKVPLPTATPSTGNFLDHVFDRAVHKVRERWSMMWDCWTQRKPLGSLVIPDWNLNTGTNCDTGKAEDLWQA
jgi:hypothetical protein